MTGVSKPVAVVDFNRYPQSHPAFLSPRRLARLVTQGISLSSQHEKTPVEPEAIIQKRFEELADRLKKLRTDPEQASVEASSLEATLSSIRAGVIRQREFWKSDESEE